MNPRRGFTLIEMLAVITGMTLLMGLSVVTIQSLLHAEQSARQSAVETQRRHVLASAFRVDVHAATRHQADASPFGPGLERLTLTLSDTDSVEYRVDKDGRLTVTRHVGERKEPVIETYPARATPDAHAQLGVSTFEGATLIRLDLPIAPGRPTLITEAVLGRDHRHESHREEATP